MLENDTHRLIDGTWMVRVTHMLDKVHDKGVFFKKWLQQWGFEADKQRDKAGDSGTRIHKACEGLIKNGKISVSDYGLNEVEYKKVLGFINFCKEFKPEFMGTEVTVNDGKCSGRADLILKIGDKKYVPDIKTGSDVYDEHMMQASFYGKCLDAIPAILHLKATTKKGYQFVDLSCMGKEKKDERERWLEAYELSHRMYVLRGFPLEPKESMEIPKIITLEV